MTINACAFLGTGGRSRVLAVPQSSVLCQTALSEFKSIHLAAYNLFTAFEVLCKHLSMACKALLRVFLSGCHP